MAELQRSAMSFRRQGSSGQVFDDKFLAEINKITQQQQQNNNINDNNQENNNHLQKDHAKDETVPAETAGLTVRIDRSRSSGGGRAFRTHEVVPAIEPPSPRLSACGICSAFGKREKGRKRPKSGKQKK